MFTLNGSQDYPLGRHFDQGLFSALTVIDDTLLERDPESYFSDQKYYDMLFRVYEQLSTNIEEEHQKIQRMKQASDEEKIQILSVSMRLALVPLLTIAKGMKQAPCQTRVTWSKVQMMSPEKLADRIQGVFSREELVKQVLFHERVPEQIKEWVTEWLTTSPLGKLQQFIRAATGANSLGRHTSISIEPPNISLPQVLIARTCFNRIEIPLSFENKGRFFYDLNVFVEETSFTTI
jgi:hypothetical protein